MTEERKKGIRAMFWITTIILITIGLVVVLFIESYMRINDAARDIKQNMKFYGKSLEYVKGFLDGVEYLRWYLNDRAVNATAGNMSAGG